MLPDDVAFAGGAIDQIAHGMFDIERRAVAGAVAKRRREFGAGRSYARAALAAFAPPSQPIPAGADRCPIWPSGFVGSISHCDHFCVAIAGRSAAYAGLGIDIEDDAPLENGVRHIVCRPDERREAAFDCSIDVAKVLFVVKEAIFKTYYPATRVFLDFHDVAVALDERDQSFRAELAAADKPALAGKRYFQGRLGSVEGHLIAVVTAAVDARSHARRDQTA